MLLQQCKQTPQKIFKRLLQCHEREDAQMKAKCRLTSESVISGFLRFVSSTLNDIHVLQYDADDVLTVLLTLRPKRETRERPAATAPSSHETLKTHKIFPNDFQPFLFRTQSKFCGKTQFLMHIYCPYALSSRKAAVVRWQIVSLLLAIVLTFSLMF